MNGLVKGLVSLSLIPAFMSAGSLPSPAVEHQKRKTVQILEVIPYREIIATTSQDDLKLRNLEDLCGPEDVTLTIDGTPEIYHDLDARGNISDESHKEVMLRLFSDIENSDSWNYEERQLFTAFTKYQLSREIPLIERDVGILRNQLGMLAVNLSSGLAKGGAIKAVLSKLLEFPGLGPLLEFTSLFEVEKIPVNPKFHAGMLIRKEVDEIEAFYKQVKELYLDDGGLTFEEAKQIYQNLSHYSSKIEPLIMLAGTVNKTDSEEFTVNPDDLQAFRNLRWTGLGGKVNPEDKPSLEGIVNSIKERVEGSVEWKAYRAIVSSYLNNAPDQTVCQRLESLFEVQEKEIYPILLDSIREDRAKAKAKKAAQEMKEEQEQKIQQATQQKEEQIQVIQTQDSIFPFTIGHTWQYSATMSSKNPFGGMDIPYDSETLRVISVTRNNSNPLFDYDYVLEFSMGEQRLHLSANDKQLYFITNERPILVSVFQQNYKDVEERNQAAVEEHEKRLAPIKDLFKWLDAYLNLWWTYGGTGPELVDYLTILAEAAGDEKNPRESAKRQIRKIRFKERGISYLDLGDTEEYPILTMNGKHYLLSKDVFNVVPESVRTAAGTFEANKVTLDLGEIAFPGLPATYARGRTFWYTPEAGFVKIEDLIIQQHQVIPGELRITYELVNSGQNIRHSPRSATGWNIDYKNAKISFGEALLEFGTDYIIKKLFGKRGREAIH